MFEGCDAFACCGELVGAGEGLSEVVARRHEVTFGAVVSGNGSLERTVHADEGWIAPGRVEGLISPGGWSHACTEEVSR